MSEMKRRKELQYAKDGSESYKQAIYRWQKDYASRRRSTLNNLSAFAITSPTFAKRKELTSNVTKTTKSVDQNVEWWRSFRAGIFYRANTSSERIQPDRPQQYSIQTSSTSNRSLIETEQTTNGSIRTIRSFLSRLFCFTKVRQ
uniref:AlNc14C54G4153 protein n=1 Tax=Albugo laibachii Nc14 TaxID=890382 RepID=F0WBW5_9STRA|nr:AlNc14C54G4153 [Albugo laibachii Nc14]|eukprot:CCA18644.1 AlNc14C54G4153 [Albugo laibachii Nc14]